MKKPMDGKAVGPNFFFLFFKIYTYLFLWILSFKNCFDAVVFIPPLSFFLSITSFFLSDSFFLLSNLMLDHTYIHIELYQYQPTYCLEFRNLSTPPMCVVLESNRVHTKQQRAFLLVGSP